MRWPWQRPRTEPAEEVEQAHRDAERKLAEACRRDREVREVTEKLRELRRRNHFAEIIAESMRVRRP